jgi:hypothetical protein
MSLSSIATSKYVMGRLGLVDVSAIELRYDKDTLAGFNENTIAEEADRSES